MKKWIYRILTVFFLCVFLFSAWKLFDIWKGSQQVKNETSQLEQYLTSTTTTPEQPEAEEKTAQKDREEFLPDWAALQAQNPDIIAWIIVPGTDINLPVVQGADNTYYLTHTTLGAENYRGSIFLDANASRDFTTDNSLIFGHSVDIGGMFTQLKEFTSQSFFDSHPYFWILTPSQNYKCEVTAFTSGTDSSAVYTSQFGDFRSQVLESIASQALYTRDIPDSGNWNLVSLSTCNLNYGYGSDQRYILSAYMVPYDDPVYKDEL